MKSSFNLQTNKNAFFRPSLWELYEIKQFKKKKAYKVLRVIIQPKKKPGENISKYIV